MHGFYVHAFPACFASYLKGLHAKMISAQANYIVREGGCKKGHLRCELVSVPVLLAPTSTVSGCLKVITRLTARSSLDAGSLRTADHCGGSP